MSQRRQHILASLFGAFLMAAFLGVIFSANTAAEARIAQDTPAPTVTLASISCEDTDGNVACYYGDDAPDGTMVITFYPYGADVLDVTLPASLTCPTDLLCLITITPYL